jgi:hypothetical protein
MLRGFRLFSTMQLAQTMGAGVAVLTLGWFAFTDHSPAANGQPLPPTPAVANGHYTLVVEGDRNALAITTAVWKEAPWAGVATGFASKWQLRILAADGALLAAVPLDVSSFATGLHEVGKAPTVTGCVVRDSKIGILVNVPAFAAAHAYQFVRDDGFAQPTGLGTIAGSQIANMSGGGR